MLLMMRDIWFLDWGWGEGEGEGSGGFQVLLQWVVVWYILVVCAYLHGKVG